MSLNLSSSIQNKNNAIMNNMIKDKRIAELQQTVAPLELGVSEIEMAVSRSKIFFITNLVYIHFLL